MPMYARFVVESKSPGNEWYYVYEATHDGEKQAMRFTFPLDQLHDNVAMLYSAYMRPIVVRDGNGYEKTYEDWEDIEQLNG